MLEIQRKYVHNYENVDVYFIQSSYQYHEDVHFENDMVYIRNHEKFETILYKTLITMKALHNINREYDFTIRTNISTIIDILKLQELLSLFTDKEYLYAGDLAGIWQNAKRYWFALGTCIILSKTLSNKMIDSIDKFNHQLPDDVSIGIFITKNYPESYDNNIALKNYIFYSSRLPQTMKDSKVEHIKRFFNNTNHEPNYICYRNSTNDRFEDVKIMDYICNHIILKNK
jgi:hypothetical protein